MKIIKGLAIFCVAGMLFGSCFSPPELSSTPTIGYSGIYFTTSSIDTVKDSLVLIINFKDGDGDLGLNTDDPKYREYPYNPLNYFLADGNGGLQPVGFESIQLINGNGSIAEVLSPVLVIPSNTTGKLVTNRTRKNPNYADKLPGFPSAYPCPTYAYSYDSVAVVGGDSVIFDNTYHVKRVIRIRETNSNKLNKVFILQDTLYYEPNPKFTNISVKFMVKNNDGSYTEFDWRKNYCGTFDQRFPVLSEKNGALEGTLKYGMTSKGFLALFSVKTLKLSIQIQDRAFHVSNTIETPDFTLSGIKR